MLVPVEHAPLEAAVAAVQREPPQPRQHRLADAGAAVAGAHEQVFEVQPRLGEKGREVGEEERERDDSPFALGDQRLGDRPVVECVVGEVDSEVVAFALFFTNFSTFLAKPGLYLEDLYVKPEHRGRGLGRALLEHLGALAVQRDYGRFEWSVLDWNEHAIRFYKGMGATVMPEWRICRVTGDALQRFAP